MPQVQKGGPVKSSFCQAVFTVCFTRENSLSAVNWPSDDCSKSERCSKHKCVTWMRLVSLLISVHLFAEKKTNQRRETVFQTTPLKDPPSNSYRICFFVFFGFVCFFGFFFRPQFKMVWPSCEEFANMNFLPQSFSFETPAEKWQHPKHTLCLFAVLALGATKTPTKQSEKAFHQNHEW